MLGVRSWARRPRGWNDKVAQLQLSLYGTRDAAQNWAATYARFLKKLGFRQDKTSTCNFVHVQRDIKPTVHGTMWSHFSMAFVANLEIFFAGVLRFFS